MSEYNSDYSRTPTPKRQEHHSKSKLHHDGDSKSSHHRHRSHDRSKSTTPSDLDSFSTNKKRRRPLESSPYTFFVIIIICMFIQIMLMGETKLNLSRPTENELPLAFMINRFFDWIPIFSFMYDLTDHPKESLLISLLIYLIYRILCSTSRSPFTSFLISLMFLFDETTYNLIATNPSFGVQLILMSICINICQNLLVTEILTSTWITYAVIDLLLGFFATFISIEAFTIFIPITISIILLSGSSDEKSKTSFCKKIYNIIIASLYLVILCSICLAIAFSAFLIGPPKFVVDDNDLDNLISEYLHNGHNISLLFMALITAILFFFTDIEFAWFLSFIGCFIFTVFLAFSSVVNDLEVKVALSTYYFLLCCGFVLTNPKVSNVSALFLVFYCPIVYYFYKYPI